MTRTILLRLTLTLLVVGVSPTAAFLSPKPTVSNGIRYPLPTAELPRVATSTSLSVVQDLAVIGLVAGQENYGLAVVCVGEALWSFVQAPSLSHARVLVPAALAAVILVAVSGPMITSGDVGSVSTGLWIATGVSTGLGLSYIARLIAPYSPSSKEVAALGLLVAIAGFFSFAQNLVVDGFVSFPSLPSLPSFEFPELNFDLDAAPPVPKVEETVVESISAPMELLPEAVIE